jgi:multidrug efflux pump subunit AcrB
MQKNNKKGLREFKLTSLSVDNGITVLVLTFVIVLFGALSYRTMPKESFPEIEWTQIYISTVYFGNSAEDIENLITRPLEKEIAAIDEIKNVTSSSMQDYSIITAEFNTDVSLEQATRLAKDAVDKARPELPTDLTQEPEVIDINLSELPIMTVNLSGDYPMDELRNYAEYFQDKIEDLSEISKVDIKGTREREVTIEVDMPKLQAVEVNYMDIENAIKSENLTMSGGEIIGGGYRRSIRIEGEFNNLDEIRNVIVKSEDNLPVFLKDVAKVTFGYQEETSIARSDGLPVVSLDVIKRSGENLLDASDKIKEVVNQSRIGVIPNDLKIHFFNDHSITTRSMVSNLENSILFGMLLVVTVLLFFLGVRNSLFVGVAIPLSMMTGIMLLGMIGYTMNMVVLFSLILALGMLVDNAIVVVENIYRYRQEGYGPIEAAKYGTGEVAMPIIISTITTIAAFLPLAFWPDLMGEFMKFLPITLIVVLSSSLFVALVINPVLTTFFMRLEKKYNSKEKRKRTVRVLVSAAIFATIGLLAAFGQILWLRNIAWILVIVVLANYFILNNASRIFQDRFMPVLESIYDKFIRFALHRYNPVFTFIGTFILLIAAIMLLGANMPNVVLFPSTDPSYVNAFVELPLGKDIKETDDISREIEDRLSETIKPYRGIIDAVLTQIGENTGDPAGDDNFGASPHKARLTVSFVESEQRGDVNTFDVMDEIRKSLKGIPGVNIVVDKNQDGPPTGKPINIEVTGQEINTLLELGDDVIKYINNNNVQGVEELKSNVKIGKPELLVNINREAARRYGLSTYSIADAIRTSVFGKEISKYKIDEDDYPIQLRINDSQRYDINALMNQKVTFRSASTGMITQVPIAAVADYSYSSTYNSINRKNEERIITIQSNVLKGYNANEVVEEVKELLTDYSFPEGYDYTFTGEQEEQQENMAFLTRAFGIALALIFLILIAQFNSVISPFIIMLSVLFSTIGVFLGYVFTGMDIQIVMTGVGIISLAGIVVNNAIVLVDYINLLIRRKRDSLGIPDSEELSVTQIKESIIEGGSTRLRPVLLTAITTVLGLIPLALGLNINFITFIQRLDPQFFMGGDNAAFWGTMAWTVINGLIFATFLTLVVVPVMYWLAYRLLIFSRRISKKLSFEE